MTNATRLDSTSLSSVTESPYSLDSITRTTAPDADDTRDWHSYVIGQGNNRIVGCRPGSAGDVRRAAEELVTRLNERRSFRPGRKHLAMGQGKKG
ncbi:MAG TPA: hypothetical protein VKB41_01360 [Steroidobacteraceae bacterium]|nr:hypothetical protein [Steroidobacteraceae bacterium]